MHVVRQGLGVGRQIGHLHQTGAAEGAPEVDDGHVFGGDVILGKGAALQGVGGEGGQTALPIAAGAAGQKTGCQHQSQEQSGPFFDTHCINPFL